MKRQMSPEYLFGFAAAYLFQLNSSTVLVVFIILAMT